MTRPCPLCGAELAADEHLCRACSGATRGRLRAVPGLLDELDTSLARIGSNWTEPGGIRGRATGGCKPGCDHAPDNSACAEGVALGMSVAASEAAMQLRVVLHGWARVWDEETPLPDPHLEGPRCFESRQFTCRHRSCTDIAMAGESVRLRRERDRAMAKASTQALLLAGQHLAGRIWAPDLATEVRAAVRQAEHAIDRAPDLELAGTCQCGMTLYAQEGDKRVRCRWCGAEHEHDRAAMLAALPAALAEPLPKSDIARLLGMPVGTLHRWSSEGRIVPVLVDTDGRPRFDPRPIAQAVRDGIPPALPERRHKVAHGS